MDMSCPACYVAITPKAAIRIRFISQEAGGDYRCPYCGAEVTKTNAYASKFKRSIVAGSLPLVGFFSARFIGLHIHTIVGAVIGLIIFIAVGATLIHWLPNYWTKHSPNPYWKLKNASTK